MVNLNVAVEEFKKTYEVARAIYWDSKCGKFYPRAYSATVIAQKTNEAFNKFKRTFLPTANNI